MLLIVKSLAVMTLPYMCANIRCLHTVPDAPFPHFAGPLQWLQETGQFSLKREVICNQYKDLWSYGVFPWSVCG